MSLQSVPEASLSRASREADFGSGAGAGAEIKTETETQTLSSTDTRAAARVAGCRRARVTGLHLAAQVGDVRAAAALLQGDVDVNAAVRVETTATPATAAGEKDEAEENGFFARPIDFAAACCVDARGGAAVLRLLLKDARIRTDTLGGAYAVALAADAKEAKGVLRGDPRCKIGARAVAASWAS